MTIITEAISTGFHNKKIAIIGDLVADQFLNGTISRVSREAPVFILSHRETTTLPGAAANAAANVASLGGIPLLFGFVGTDTNGEHLISSLEVKGVSCEHVIFDRAVTTTTKVRVLAGQHYAARQQVIRIDYENSASIPSDVKERMLAGLAAGSDNFDAIIVSDYGYGAVFPEVYSEARRIAQRRGIPLVVDSRHRLESFTGATAATPNREEVENIAGKDFTDEHCFDLKQRLDCRALLVTNGNKGMSLYFEGDKPLHIDVVGSSEPVDVTGAGDTVIAAFSLGLSMGLSFADAASVANHAGGIVVMKKRTATVNIAELTASLISNAPLNSFEDN